jgi:hypothetical protein
MSVIKSSRSSPSNRRVAPAEGRFMPKLVTEIFAEAGRLQGSPEHRIVGLLFGRQEQGLVSLEAFVGSLWERSSEHQILSREYLETNLDRMLSTSKSKPELASLEVVGWCSLEPTDDDGGALRKYVDFYTARFRRASDVFLILGLARASVLSGRIYARLSRAPFSAEHHALGEVLIDAETGARQPTQVALSEAADPSLYVITYERMKELEMAERRPWWKVTALSIPELSNIFRSNKVLAPPVSTAPAAAATVAIPPRLPNQIGSRGNTGKIRWIAYGTAVLGLALVPAFLLRRNGSSHQQIAVALPQPAHLNARLALELQSRDGALLLRWDRNAAPIRSASKGVLDIRDGSTNRSIALKPVELEDGSILYKASSSEVHFLLTVYDSAGSAVTDGILALDGTVQTATDDPGSVRQLSPAEIVPRHAVPETAPRATSNTRPERTASLRPAPTPASPSQPELNEQLATTEQVAAAQSALDVAPPVPSKGPPAENDVPPKSGSSATPLHTAAVERSQGAVPGDIVPAYVQARPVQTAPLNPALLRHTDFSARLRIEVEVEIDDHGRVTSARIPPGAKTKPGLATLAAITAAKQWRFEPAKMHGQNVASKHTVVFELSPRPQ